MKKNKSKPKMVQKAEKVKTGKTMATIKRKILGSAPEEYAFVLSDGRKLRTILELIDELETMTEQEFKRYVNEFKNDFANWIRDIFDEKILAEELTLTKDRLEAQRALLKHIVRELYKELLQR